MRASEDSYLGVKLFNFIVIIALFLKLERLDSGRFENSDCSEILVHIFYVLSDRLVNNT